VRQVCYLQRLHRDARSTVHKYSLYIVPRLARTHTHTHTHTNTNLDLFQHDPDITFIISHSANYQYRLLVLSPVIFVLSLVSIATDSLENAVKVYIVTFSGHLALLTAKISLSCM
jgi:hypothetical protein